MLFQLGAIVATPGALRHCTISGVDPMSLIFRHGAGDWGDLDSEDVAANVLALQHDLRVFSSYVFGDGKVWCITEADRSSTCLLLPEEY
ncbi:MAG: hypothetical protein IPG77_04920 [Betaproteobacteria bacterium]|nr:hypothetical protein [Betaproteobacteria bacterium]